MSNPKLLIKYNNKYVCEKRYNSIDFIYVPKYHDVPDFSNISIFILLFMSGNLNSEYSSTKALDYYGWLEINESTFFPEYLYQVNEDTYIYDVDKILSDDLLYEDIKEALINSLNNLIDRLVLVSLDELIDIAQNEYHEEFDDEFKYSYTFEIPRINKALINTLKKFNPSKSDKDVLMMYSGGKDSTLAAIRLHNQGYQIHFVHFDNGCMKDSDKPFLTYKKTFFEKDGFIFDYKNSQVDIEDLFKTYYSEWVKIQGGVDSLADGTLTSEIRCLSCRMAMYTKAIMIAKVNGFKYIADGARISQKFMLEQEPMIERFKELAKQHGIELLFPVLYLDDDRKEIAELLANGYSAKTWESKCLIGRAAKDKTESDEQTIIDYYENNIKRLVLDNTNDKASLFRMKHNLD